MAPVRSHTYLQWHLSSCKCVEVGLRAVAWLLIFKNRRLSGLDEPILTCFSLLLEQEEHHLMEVDSFVEEHGKEYLTVKVIRPDDEVENAEARNLGM